MSDYKQYNYTGPNELYNNFKGRYTTINKTSQGIIFNSSSDKNAKVSGMLLAEKIQGYKYKTYVIKVVAASLTTGAMPYIYTGFSQAVSDRKIIEPAQYNGTYSEYTVQFTLPETRLFDIGVLFSHKNIVMHSVAVNSISLYCIEDEFYVLTHKDSEIDSIKNFSGDNITAKKLIVEQIDATGDSIIFSNITCDSVSASTEIIVGYGGIATQGIITSNTGYASEEGFLNVKNIILSPGGDISGTGTIDINGDITADSVTLNGGNLITQNGSMQTGHGNINTTTGSIITNSGNISTISGNFSTTTGNVSAHNINTSGSITSTGKVTVNNTFYVNPGSGITGIAITGTGKAIHYNGLDLNGPLTVINGAGITGIAGSTLSIKGITGISDANLSVPGWYPLYYNKDNGFLAFNTG